MNYQKLVRWGKERDRERDRVMAKRVKEWKVCKESNCYGQKSEN